MRYGFAPAGFTPTAANEFYIYVSHYKAGDAADDFTDRNKEAVIIRNNSATLPSNARVLYVAITTSTAAVMLRIKPLSALEPIKGLTR